jgi:hypothetical protein
LERKIYGEYVNVPGRKLTGMDPVEEKGYRRPTIKEAREYFCHRLWACIMSFGDALSQ